MKILLNILIVFLLVVFVSTACRADDLQHSGTYYDSSGDLKWFHDAADKGDLNAMKQLGDMYRDGRGVPKSLDEAVKWYAKAADKGDLKTMKQLGDIYLYGRGMPKNTDEALKWYRKAVEKGDHDEAFDLGRIYKYGVGGVKQDYAETAKWYKLGISQGGTDTGAEMDLAEMYKDGNGVKRDPIEAYYWMRIATVFLEGRASPKSGMQKLIDEIRAEHLTAEQKEAVDKRVLDRFKGSWEEFLPQGVLKQKLDSTR